MDFAPWASRASWLVYENPEEIRHALDLNRLDVLEVEGLPDAVIGSNRNITVLVYRGSLPPLDFLKSGDHLLNVVRDWTANLNWGLREGWGWEGRVCSGFADRVDETWEKVSRKVLKHLEHGPRLLTTGHSQGGAKAILAGARFASQGLPMAAVYSFGAPRTGNGAFIHSYSTPLFRYENRHDPVPWFPTSMLDDFSAFMEWVTSTGGPADFPAYRHPGHPLFIDWDGNISTPGDSYVLGLILDGLHSAATTFGGFLTSLTDHNSARYAEVLQRA